MQTNIKKISIFMVGLLFLLSTLLITPITTASAATVNVTTDTALLAALAAANSGDIIVATGVPASPMITNINIPTGVTLKVDGASHINFAGLTINSGANLIIDSGGAMSAPGGTTLNMGTIENSGHFSLGTPTSHLNNKGTFIIKAGTFHNTGKVENEGNFRITGGSFDNHAESINKGKFAVETGGMLVINAAVGAGTGFYNQETLIFANGTSLVENIPNGFVNTGLKEQSFDFKDVAGNVIYTSTLYAKGSYVIESDLLTPATNPTLAGATFDNWFSNGIPLVGNTFSNIPPAVGPLTFTAGWNYNVAENPSDANNYTMKSTADFAKFQSVEIDGTTLDTSNYKAESGSTIITFTDAYINSLTAGTTYNITVIFTDGKSTSTINVPVAGGSSSTANNSSSTPSASSSTSSSNITNGGNWPVNQYVPGNRSDDYIGGGGGQNGGGFNYVSSSSAVAAATSSSSSESSSQSQPAATAPVAPSTRATNPNTGANSLSLRTLLIPIIIASIVVSLILTKKPQED